MAQSSKMKTTTPKSNVPFISPEFFEWFMSITDEGSPMYSDPLPDHIRHAVLDEVRLKVKHAYNSQGR